MGIRVALEHRTTYRYDRPVRLGPHLIRLRPAPHCRTPVEAYSLAVCPEDHHLTWQQDPFGNHVARVVFPEPAETLDVTVGIVADLSVINPFDFLVEDYATRAGFSYPRALAADLRPYRDPVEEEPGAGPGPHLQRWLDRLDASRGQPIVEFLAAVNAAVYGDVAYSLRMEPGVQTPDQTLTRAVGSCRDSAWLLVAALRHVGLAARFVSGYLVQLAPDVEEGVPPDLNAPTQDFTDLHAWAEAFVPGAGWIGLDPTSALFAGEGHLPLAATPQPGGAAPIAGSSGPAGVSFTFANAVRRFVDAPRVRRPYSAEQVAAVHALGERVDERLAGAGLELTMGGEPTFVSREDPLAAEWTVAADGPQKRRLAHALAVSLATELAPGAVVCYPEGKWYPGETEPRWQIALVWRRDGEPLWTRADLRADPQDPATARPEAAADAEALARWVTGELGLPADVLLPAYEDPLAALQTELARPEGPPPERDPDRPDLDWVHRLDALVEPTAWVLPLTPAWWGEGWASARWRTRRGRLVLGPGTMPAGRRLPLGALSWRDPDPVGEASYLSSGPAPGATRPRAVVVDADQTPARTALVVEARAGRVHVFLPPLEKWEKHLELVRLIERAADATGIPVVLEGYGPPPDPRIAVLSVTPDPGVIEVNLPPAVSWPELAGWTTRLYALARGHGLVAETFGLDGRHSGTGGGCHLTLGGPEPRRSPLLRRPDLLVSMLTFWQHHPCLSYLFSGRFVGPTSQAPRVDEGRPENLYELEIAFAEIERLADTPEQREEHRLWVVDRELRHLLTDLTGNSHRSEFCIDKLYRPDSLRGRLGLLELRAFEMPPHPEMALAQALLVRALVTRLAEDPYRAPLVRWGARLHEQYLLPHVLAADLAEVVADLRAHDLDVDPAWFEPFVEFRFPRIGVRRIAEMELELRSALEPWHVLGEEMASAGTARYVDSSTERIQVRVDGFDPERYAVTCNGALVPMTGTGTPGRYVAGIRFKAWRPWSSLHPSLAVDAPLVVEVVDLASRLSRGGATYHVVHPGGRAYEHPPVNAQEAEARRSSRFSAVGHTTGVIDVAALDAARVRRGAGTDDQPLTLDLRRRVPRRWGRG